MKGRVVITGIGLVSSLGYLRDYFWQAVRVGRHGISKVQSFDTVGYKKIYGGEVKDFPVNNIFSVAERRVYGRASQLAIFATHQALADSGLPSAPYWNELRLRTAVVVGTTFGESKILERADELLVSKPSNGSSHEVLHLEQYNPNTLSVNIAKKYGLAGPNYVVPTACSAGNHAIGLGASLIRTGRADVVIAGGADPFSRVAFSGFARLGVMADEKCQPFDKNRKGMLVGEGAGIVVLENNELATRRGAKGYAEVLGLGVTCDARHMTIPDVDGMIRAMDKAIENSQLTARDIDYVCAHGTGTILNDKTESMAIRKVFYEKGNPVPVSSIKSMLGHSMGAASALEVIACALAIKNEEIPPTINYETADPECDIDCVPNRSRPKKLKIVLNNSFAFGGNNACLVLAKI